MGVGLSIVMYLVIKTVMAFRDAYDIGLAAPHQMES